MNLLFSLVLPVYKVESYIEKCIVSCLEQKDIDPNEYEIILVDDGTPDRSIEVALNVIGKHPKHHVKIIHQENGGLSAARNAGMKAAEGEYIWFIDSDDWIRGDALSLLKEKLDEIGAVEILSFLHQVVYSNGELSSMALEKDYFSEGIYYLKKNDFLSACSRIYKKEFLLKKQLYFCEGYLWEDAQLNIRALAICEKHYFYNAYLYFYFRRENSITTSGLSEIMEESRFYLIDSVIDSFDSYSFTPYKQTIICNKLAKILLAAIVGIYELPENLSLKFKKRFREKRNIYLEILFKSGNIKFQLIMLLLKVNFTLVSKILTWKLHKIQRNNKLFSMVR